MRDRRAPIAIIALAVLILVSPDAQPARGDRLYTGHDGVVLRVEPSAGAPRLMVLGRGHLLVEAQARDDWVRVGVARTGGVIGWIDRRSLTSVRPAPLPPSPRPAFEYFVTVLERFNRDVQADTGEALFDRVEPITDEIIQLTATDFWLRLPARAMRRNLGLIADRWADVNGSGNPTWVQVATPDGRVVMSERRGS